MVEIHRLLDLMIARRKDTQKNSIQRGRRRSMSMSKWWKYKIYHILQLQKGIIH